MSFRNFLKWERTNIIKSQPSLFSNRNTHRLVAFAIWQNRYRQQVGGSRWRAAGDGQQVAGSRWRAAGGGQQVAVSRWKEGDASMRAREITHFKWRCMDCRHYDRKSRTFSVHQKKSKGSWWGNFLRLVIPIPGHLCMRSVMLHEVAYSTNINMLMFQSNSGPSAVAIFAIYPTQKRWFSVLIGLSKLIPRRQCLQCLFEYFN